MQQNCDNLTMYPIKKIVVCLDLSEIDEILIEYASLMCAVTKAEKLIFMHVARVLEIPKEIREEFPDLLPADNETLLKRINSCIDCSLNKDLAIDTELVLEEGNPTQEIAGFAKDKDVDLVIIGRKIELAGTGIIPQKLIRVLSCNVLIIPEKNPNSLDKIMVPIDFSKQSGDAVESGIMLARTMDIGIIFQNVYHLPSGYLSTGKTEEEFAGIMKHHAIKDCQQFMKKYDLSGISHDFIYTLDDNKRPAMEIYDTALKHGVSLIVVGSKGRTAAAHILLGSVAEQLANYDSQIPLFITKDKKESLSFFEALMRL